MTGRRGRGYSWEPFVVGNRAAERHGAYSERAVAPLAAELASGLAADAPWTARPAFRASVASWARTEARLQLLASWLGEVGDLDEVGRPRPAAVLLDRLEARAAKLRAALGLDPGSLARLMLTVSAVGRSAQLAGGALDGVLEELIAEGRASLAARAPGALEAAEGAEVGR